MFWLWLLGAVNRGDWRSILVGGGIGAAAALLRYRRQRAVVAQLEPTVAPPPRGGERVPTAGGNVVPIDLAARRRAGHRSLPAAEAGR